MSRPPSPCAAVGFAGNHAASARPFTQKDPIGLAGGLNQYGFSSGDPINNSDPFGLTVCFGGNQSERESLAREFMQATGTKFDLKDMDANGCVSNASISWTSNVDSRISREVRAIIRGSDRVTLRYGRLNSITEGRGSGFDGQSFLIDTTDVGQLYGVQYQRMSLQRDPTKIIRHCDGDGSTYDLAQIIVHELGHVVDYQKGAPGPFSSWAVRLENYHNASKGKTQRPDLCH